MATLPEMQIDLTHGVEFRDQPSLTWIYDPISNRLRGWGDGYEALRQAVEIICNVERFRWQIYSPNFGIELEGLLGTEPGYAASELRRRLEDAFSADRRLLGLSRFDWRSDGERLFAETTVDTVFGPVPAALEVKL